MQPVRLYAATFFLVMVGTLQMAGDLANIKVAKALGFALAASPAPKVFTIQNGFETYANRFFLVYDDVSGGKTKVAITPKNYQGIRGPYNRRNAFGAATSYGPVLSKSSITRPMLESVLRHSFCGQSIVAEELAIIDRDPDGETQVIIEPMSESFDRHGWSLQLGAACGD